MVWLSILLVGACAVCWDLGVVLQKRAADSLPPLVPGKGLGATLWRFARSPGWMGGGLVSAAGYVLFATALTFTPVSVARSVQGLGFVVLAVMSIFFLNHRLTAREWAGVLGVTAGVVLLGLSEPREQVEATAIDLSQLAVGVAVTLALCGLVVLLRKLAPQRVSGTVAVGLGAGALLGLGDVLTRALILELPRSSAVAFGVIGPSLVATYLTGFFMLSRAYQHGRALVVTGVSDLAARLVAVFMGVLAMDEALPADPVLRAARVAGFAAILVCTGLLAHFSALELAQAQMEK